MANNTVVGVIAGSSLLKSDIFSSYTPQTVVTARGSVILFKGTPKPGFDVYFCQRHVSNPETESYTIPSEINFASIALALQSVGCGSVVSICSVGSLRADMHPGTLVVLEDYWDLHNANTAVSSADESCHFTPRLDEALRSSVLAALTAAGLSPHNGGTYMQTRGPRFETRAEIRSLAQLGGDVVGMTAAREATACGELRIPHCLLAMVDNYAHGIVASDLTLESFRSAVANNQTKVQSAVAAVLNHLSGGSGSGDGDAEADGREAVDTIVHAPYVIPVLPEGAVYRDHAVAVRDGTIVAVLPSAAMDAQYKAADTQRLTSHALMPGFVNAHTHASMVLLRGCGDDLPLMQWLSERVWKAEGQWVSPQFVEHGTRQAAAEMIRSGTTCYADMYFFPDVAAEVTKEVGIRAVHSFVVMEFPTAWASGPDEYLAKGKQVFEKFTTTDAAARTLHFAWGPHAPYTVSDGTWARVAEAAQGMGVPVHTHVHETAGECCESAAQNKSSMQCHLSDEATTPLMNLRRLGVAGPSLSAAHMVHLTDEEIALCAADGTTAVHCPSSNLKLASGIARVADLLAAGVNVALGTDGAASNNSLDMLSELKLAAMLAKGKAMDATVVPAAQALTMATLNGAKAMGLQDTIGSLTPGKDADMVAIALGNVECRPVYDVISHIVYVAGRENVSHSWVAGRQLMRDRQLLTLDAEAVLQQTLEWEAKIGTSMAPPPSPAAAAAAAADDAAEEGEGEGEGGESKA